jgi:sugar lactone lactonase YvrE
MLRWDTANETLSVFRQPSNYANGNTRDRQRRLVTWRNRGCRAATAVAAGILGSGALVAVCFDEAFDKLVDIARFG